MSEYLSDPLDPLWLETRLTDECRVCPGLAFHKTIAIKRGLYDRKGGGVWSDTLLYSGTEPVEIIVLPDQTDVPPHAKIIKDFAVGDPVGNPYPGNDGRTYRDIHTHDSPSSYICSVPARQQVVE